MDHRERPTANHSLPATVEFNMQPYGTEILGELSLGSYNGYATLEGTVLSGSETSRIGACRSTQDTTGRHRTVYGITVDELEAGRIVRIAG